jgi:hypothetical protein
MIAVAAVGLSIAGVAGIVTWARFARHCRQEAARCDREARRWAEGAEGLRTLAGWYAERMRGANGADAAGYRGLAARARYLAALANHIATRYREESALWGRWLTPLDPVDVRSLWREPSEADLAAYAPP